MSYCAFLQRIAEMNLDSTCGQSYGTGSNTLTTEQILLSLLSRMRSSNGSYTVFPVVRTERNVGCVVLKFFVDSSDPA
jgi:hypothetical protein